MSAYWLLLPAAVLLVLVILNCRISSRRSHCIRRLNERTCVDLTEEYGRVATKVQVPQVDIERLWKALAGLYQIPTDRIRANDRVDRELAGALQHPDYDPFLSNIFNARPTEVTEEFSKVKDWGDFLIAVYRIEQQEGRQATIRVVRDGEVVHKWAE